MTRSAPDYAAACGSWHPIAASCDLPLRHVFHAQLLGRELAVWRADDGTVNVWENRCLHRGVRLSIGINDGTELVCQYHGWRYANRTAACTYIPAHPADSPARTICNRTFAVVERYGLVWSGEQPSGQPELPITDTATGILRALPVNAGVHLVAEELTGYRLAEAAGVDLSLDAHGDFVYRLSSSAHSAALWFVLQPVDSHRSIVRPLLEHPGVELDRPTIYRHAIELERIRRRIESRATVEPIPPPLSVSVLPSPANSTMSAAPQPSGRSAPLRARVARAETVANNIRLFELVPLAGELPAAQPGAHIDVHLPNGLVRQYSLIDGTRLTDRYRIAVKREPESTGGSDFLHTAVREGDVLALSVPRNNFPLRRDAVLTLLIAGGIGITPLLSMAQALHSAALPFQLHYFVTTAEDRVLPELLDTMAPAIIDHVGLTPEQTAECLSTLLSGYDYAHHVYLCGPGGMLGAARRIAAQQGWPDTAVHFEYFRNEQPRNTDSSFTIELARSGLTLQVPAGRSILDVLRENGVELTSSCEQGACGTCRVGVLEGVPEHQDVYLNATERDAGDSLMTCVSRARSERLVLDL